MASIRIPTAAICKASIIVVTGGGGGGGGAN